MNNLQINKEAREYLEKIIAREPAELNDMNVAFLRARAEYLTEEEKEKFSMFLVPTNETKKLSFSELKAKASELGLVFNKKTKAVELEQMITEKEAELTEIEVNSNEDPEIVTQ